jgi:hypothetical protein
LRTKGNSLVLASCDDNAELERQEIDQLLARRVDALESISLRADAAVPRISAVQTSALRSDEH